MFRISNMYPVGIKSTQYDQGIFLMIFVRRIDERGGVAYRKLLSLSPPVAASADGSWT